MRDVPRSRIARRAVYRGADEMCSLLSGGFSLTTTMVLYGRLRSGVRKEYFIAGWVFQADCVDSESGANTKCQE